MKILIAASNMVHINNFHRPYIDKFREDGNEVFVMANGEGADFNIPFRKRSLSLKNFFLSFRIRRIIKKEKFDIIYLHTTLCAFWVRFALKGVRKRPYVVNTVHGYLFDENTSKLKRKVYLACEKMMRKKTDEIVVMNSEDMSIAVKNDLCLGKIHEIDGMGVDFSRFKIDRNPEENDTVDMIFVGEISKRKNQIFLVKSLEYLNNATLTLVGDGDEREAIEKYAKENGLSERLKITGFTKDVAEYIKKADLYVSASRIEGLPFNVMEAMYARMPIVASDVKGNRDLLGEYDLYPLDDMDEFVKKVKISSLSDTDYDIDKYGIENAFEKNMYIYNDALKKCKQ